MKPSTHREQPRPVPGAPQRLPQPLPPDQVELLELLKFALDSGVTATELRALMASGIQPGATCAECLGDMEPTAHGLKCVRCGASRTVISSFRGRA